MIFGFFSRRFFILISSVMFVFVRLSWFRIIMWVIFIWFKLGVMFNWEIYEKMLGLVYIVVEKLNLFIMYWVFWFYGIFWLCFVVIYWVGWFWN